MRPAAITESGDADRLEQDWLGGLVRVVIVFRLFVLLVTLVTLSPHGYSLAVGLAAVVAAALSYLPLRHWPGIRRSLTRHPTYLLSEMLISTVILGLTGARSPFFFFTLGTAVLAGAIYGRRGAIPFSIILIELYELIALEGFPTMHRLHDAQSVVLIPLLYPIAVAAGVAAREVIERGARTEELLRERSRELAAEQTRMGMAREMHDSLAKTVEGLAMTALALKSRCERNPGAAAPLAIELAADAQRAALEARALMTGLRVDEAGSLIMQLRARAEALSARSPARIVIDCLNEHAIPELPEETQHQLVRIMAEAAINAVNHGGARTVTVYLDPKRSRHCRLRMTVEDDGCGLEGPVDLDALRDRGHFGLAGMVERAESFGGELGFDTAAAGGLSVSVRVPPEKLTRRERILDRLEVMG